MVRRKRQPSDFNTEIEAHVQLETERLQEQGLNEQEARRAARRTFGNVMQTQERFYERGRWLWWDHLLQDVRFGVRMLVKSPGFTAVAVLTLALAIGVNTAIFSAVYAVLLKPLPFKDSNQLVFIEKKNIPRGWERNPISPAEIVAWRDQSGAFEDVAAYTQRHCVVTGRGEVEEDPCEVISSNLFPILGLVPIRGRTFPADADRPNGPRLIILSYELWRRRFAADENAIGQAIEVDGASYIITGVMAPNFSQWYAPPYHALSESYAQLWLSGIALSPTVAWNDYFGIGRLKHGESLQQAAAQMDTISGRIEGMYAELKGWRAQLVSLRTMSSRETRPALLVLMAATLFVLLIACANIANLLLARGASRANEFAVRNALGASHGRIVRQLLTESFLVSIAGGTLGILLASWAAKGLEASAPPILLKSAPGLASGAVDSRVLIFSFVTVILTTIIFGLAPALQSAQPQITDTLKEASRSSLESRRNRRIRNALVVSEIGVALVLLVGAGLMVRTLTQLQRVNLGFNPSNVLTMRVPLSGKRYEQPQAWVRFWEGVLSAVHSLPGVEAASPSLRLPINGWAGQFFNTAENPNPAAGQVPTANYIIIGPEYFRAMQIPLRQGRSFNEHDTQSGDKVVIINEELARLYWPGQDPVGKRLRVGGASSPWLSVVGVAGNVLTQGADAGFNPEVYVPYQQYPWLQGPKHLVVRTSANVRPESLTHAVVQQIHNLDKSVPVTDIATMELITQEALAQQRMIMRLLVSFAALALVLSALGIYSVLSYSVAQRTREIGLRVALGAERAGILRLVVGGGARLALVGIALGIGAALALTRLMADLLYGVRATDPVTFATVTILLGATSLLASYVPARRALNVDPIVALRHQ